MMNEQLLIERVKQILSVVERESYHLNGVVSRLFHNTDTVTASWLEKVSQDPMGIDQLESFSAKFCRMQDTIMDKLLPNYLRLIGEIPASAIDNLEKAEKLQLIGHADHWIELRRLRNKLVHEYLRDIEEMVYALSKARSLVDELNATFLAIKNGVQ